MRTDGDISDRGAARARVRTLRVDVPVGNLSMPYMIRIRQCQSDDDRSLSHLTLDQPGKTASGDTRLRVPWTLVLQHYQMSFEVGVREGGIPKEEHGAIWRTILLGLIGVASPRDSCAFLRQVISDRTLHTAKAAELIDFDGGDQWRNGRRYPHNQSAVIQDQSLNRVACASLLMDPLTAADRASYDQWEASHLASIFHDLDSVRGWKRQLAEVKRRVNKIQKSADNDTRRMLRLLESASQVSLMTMYPYVVRDILEQPKMAGVLDALSLSAARSIHAQQPELGGLVPALHPMWDLHMQNRVFVSETLRWAAAPDDKALFERFKAVVSESLLLYAELADEESDRQERRKQHVATDQETGSETRDLEPSETTDALDDDVLLDEEKGDSITALVDPSSGGPGSALRSVGDLLKLLPPAVRRSEPVMVFLDRTFGMTAKSCASKYQLSTKQIASREQRGRSILRHALKAAGVSFHDYLGLSIEEKLIPHGPRKTTRPVPSFFDPEGGTSEEPAGE